ncbi:MAG: HEAT repeat domain-containing protein [Bryobacteraceae bacterium]
MTCDSVVKALPLFLYGELSFEEEEAMHEHLSSCEGCRKALERERLLHAELNSMALHPAPELLAECRQDLSARLRETGPLRRNLLQRLWDWTARPLPSAALKPVGALALVVVGFLAGRMMQAPQPKSPEASYTAEVGGLEPQTSGSVRITEDESRQRVISGRPDDAATRNLLLQTALAANDPLLRMDSVVILSRSGDAPEVRQVLLHALRNDPNPAVRLKAVGALAGLAHWPDVRQGLAEALLRDDNLGVRTEAVNVLRQNLDLSMEGILRQVAQREPNDYIRAQAGLMVEAIDSTLETF